MVTGVLRLDQRLAQGKAHAIDLTGSSTQSSSYSSPSSSTSDSGIDSPPQSDGQAQPAITPASFSAQGNQPESEVETEHRLSQEAETAENQAKLCKNFLQGAEADLILMNEDINCSQKAKADQQKRIKQLKDRCTQALAESERLTKRRRVYRNYVHALSLARKYKAELAKLSAIRKDIVDCPARKKLFD